MPYEYPPNEQPSNENIQRSKEETLLETPITEEDRLSVENTGEKTLETEAQDDKALIKQKEEELNQKYADLQKKVVNEGKQQTHGIPVPPIHVKNNWWRKIAVTLGFAGAMALPQKSEAKNASDTLTKRDTIERTVGGGEDSTKKKSNIKTYTTSKTKEGAITPTGLSNSFL